MRKHVFGCSGFLLLVCVAAVPWLYLACRLDPISPHSYQRIRLGMTEQEVATSIGLRPGDYYTRHPRLGSLSGPFASPLKESGLPLADLPEQWHTRTRDGRKVTLQTWSGNTYCIWVAFDENEVVVGHYLLKLMHPRDSRLTELADGLRVCVGW